jgi:curli biogenesis system outer membrane secretion channel CsgG
MKLKPSLLKLIVTLMTISLLASCASTPETSQECNRAQAVQGQPNQQVNNCPPSSSSSSSGSRSYYSTRSGSRFGSGASDSGSSRVGSGASHSTSGRSGFGSFGRGGHGGG